MAGMNAHLKVKEQEPLILNRYDAYIGVLIDDLVTKGTEEPYRMFTSRAEYRLLLRQDNADIRLTPISNKLGLASDERMEAVNKKLASAEKVVDFFKNTSVEPTEINPYLESIDSAPINQKVRYFNVLSRPNVSIANMAKNSVSLNEFLKDTRIDAIEEAENEMKYSGYIDKEKENAEKMARLDNYVIGEDFDFTKLASLGAEAKEKFRKLRPRTVGQASRISGVNPSDISILLVHLGK
jgi:tRNA uridine 5-carboxymethylaminomethyl modification enzyme